MTLDEAHILTLRVLKQVMEEKLDQHNVQLAQVILIRATSPNTLPLTGLSGNKGTGLRGAGRNKTQVLYRRDVMTLHLKIGTVSYNMYNSMISNIGRLPRLPEFWNCHNPFKRAPLDRSHQHMQAIVIRWV